MDYRAVMTVARFEPSGRHIFVGTAQATILVFNTRTQMVRETMRSVMVTRSCLIYDVAGWAA